MQSLERIRELNRITRLRTYRRPQQIVSYLTTVFTYFETTGRRVPTTSQPAASLTRPVCSGANQPPSAQINAYSFIYFPITYS